MAFETVRTWVRPLSRPNGVAYELKNSGHCTTHPNASLDLLSSVIPEHLDYPPPDVVSCLDAMRVAAPALAQTTQFQRIDRIVRPGG